MKNVAQSPLPKKTDRFFYQQGAIATIVTLIGLLLLTAGVFVGNKVLKQKTKLRPKASTQTNHNPENKSISITNNFINLNKNETISIVATYTDLDGVSDLKNLFVALAPETNINNPASGQSNFEESLKNYFAGRYQISETGSKFFVRIGGNYFWNQYDSSQSVDNANQTITILSARISGAPNTNNLSLIWDIKFNSNFPTGNYKLYMMAIDKEGHFSDLNNNWTKMGKITITSIQTTNDPIGRLESATCNKITGWAADPDKINDPITISFFSEQTNIGTVIANKEREDTVCNITQAYSGSGETKTENCRKHGFEFNTPQVVKDGNLHDITAVAVNASGTQGNSGKDLWNSPLEINCPSLLPSATPIPSGALPQLVSLNVSSVINNNLQPITDNTITENTTLSVTATYDDLDADLKSLYIALAPDNSNPGCCHSQFEKNLKDYFAGYYRLSNNKFYTRSETNDSNSFWNQYDGNSNREMANNAITLLSTSASSISNSNSNAVVLTWKLLIKTNPNPNNNTYKWYMMAVDQTNHFSNTNGQWTQMGNLTIQSESTDNSNCLCENNGSCNTQCSFTDSSTASNKCSFTNDYTLSYSSPPDSNHKNQWCQRNERRSGDTDGENSVNYTDYLYYVQWVNGSTVPPKVNLDFNGDGIIDTLDRQIIINTINGSPEVTR